MSPVAKTETTGVRKRRLVKHSDKQVQSITKPKSVINRGKKRTKITNSIPIPQINQPQQDNNLPSYSVEAGSDSDYDDLPDLLEACSKEQLIELIRGAALEDSALNRSIIEAADYDVSHRKIFVYGLGWDTSKETLQSVFECFGEIEECKLVIDKNTGKAKGYGFVLFKTRKGAINALKNPKKQVNDKTATCQLASIGPVAQTPDISSRKIYVSGVPLAVDAERLKLYFAKYGEIESGPSGCDHRTGKSRGFALFVYKTMEGANRALEEPYKIFEGHEMHCQKAAEGRNRKEVQTQPHSQLLADQQLPIQAPVLAAVTAAQNWPQFFQNPTLNPIYAGVLCNHGMGFLANAGAMNQAVIPGTLNQMLVPAFRTGHLNGNLGGAVSAGAGGYGGSVLGAHGSTLPFMPGLQHVYPKVGHFSSSKAPGSGGAGSGYSL